MAYSTYCHPERTVAVFNTELLAKFFAAKGLAFPHSFTFEPRLNPALRSYRDRASVFVKTRTLLVYGRPSVERNAFPLVVQGLRRWAERYPNAANWEIVSVGEAHMPVPLPNGHAIVSLGKLSLKDYAQILTRSAVGLSLMISPHPSYPPLELAAFGARVITNRFANKDLSVFSPRITSIDRLDPDAIASALIEACQAYDVLGEPFVVPSKYADLSNGFLADREMFYCAHALVEALVPPMLRNLQKS